MRVLAQISSSHPHEDPAVQSVLSDLWNRPYLRAGLAVLAIWVTGMLLIRIWLVHKERTLACKIGWSFVVCLPAIGWLLYFGLSKVPKPHGDNPPVNPSAFSHL
jgi:hypothetical protein